MYNEWMNTCPCHGNEPTNDRERKGLCLTLLFCCLLCSSSAAGNRIIIIITYSQKKVPYWMTFFAIVSKTIANNDNNNVVVIRRNNPLLSWDWELIVDTVPFECYEPWHKYNNGTMSRIATPTLCLIFTLFPWMSMRHIKPWHNNYYKQQAFRRLCRRFYC